MESTGFRKLKIAVATGAMAGMLAGVGTARKATAAVICDGVTVTGGTCPIADLTIMTAGAKWVFTDDDDGRFSANGIGIGDATLTASPSRNDAYDGAFIFAVNGIVFGDPDGVVDLDGTTATSAVQTVGGFDVQVEYFVSPEVPVIRVQYILTNPTNKTITASVSDGYNLGSNGDTVIEATSNGNTTLEIDDRWLVTSDALDPEDDPVLTFSRFGRGLNRILVVPPLPYESPGAQPLAEETNGEWGDAYRVKVRRGKTARILVFGALSRDVATAIEFGETFESFNALGAAGLLDGLSNSERREVVNYGFKAL